MEGGPVPDHLIQLKDIPRNSAVSEGQCEDIQMHRMRVILFFDHKKADRLIQAVLSIAMNSYRDDHFRAVLVEHSLSAVA